MRGGAGGRGSGRGGEGAREPAAPLSIDNIGAFRALGDGTHGLTDFGYPWGDPLWCEGNFLGSTQFGSHAQAGANRLFALPAVRARATKIRQFALALSSGTNEADDTMRIGIYSDRGGYPGSRLWASDEFTLRYAPDGVPFTRYVACGFVMEASTPYWLAWIYPAAFGSTNSVMCFPGRRMPGVAVGLVMFDYAGQLVAGGNAAQSIHGGVPIVGWAHAQAYGALPATFPDSSRLPILASASFNLPAWFMSVQSYPT